MLKITEFTLKLLLFHINNGEVEKGGGAVVVWRMGRWVMVLLRLDG